MRHEAPSQTNEYGILARIATACGGAALIYAGLHANTEPATAEALRSSPVIESYSGEQSDSPELLLPAARQEPEPDVISIGGSTSEGNTGSGSDNGQSRGRDSQEADAGTALPPGQDRQGGTEPGVIQFEDESSAGTGSKDEPAVVNLPGSRGRSSTEPRPGEPAPLPATPPAVPPQAPAPSPAPGAETSPSEPREPGPDPEADPPASDFIFPLETTKASIMNRDADARWCYQSTANCHHDYNAADIMADPGTRVIAPVSGTVISINDDGSSEFGSNVAYRSDVDQSVIYLTHMEDKSIAVKPGQHIDQGQFLGVVGGSDDAAGTPAHLHIDILPKEYDGRADCSGKECTPLPFQPVQARLVEAFARLPEK